MCNFIALSTLNVEKQLYKSQLKLKIEYFKVTLF